MVRSEGGEAGEKGLGRAQEDFESSGLGHVHGGSRMLLWGHFEYLSSQILKSRRGT